MTGGLKSRPLAGRLLDIVFHAPECDGNQKKFRYRNRYLFSVPIFSGTGSGTFFQYKIFLVPPEKWKIPGNFPVLVPNFTGTGSCTFFRNQILPLPVPVPKKADNSRNTSLVTSSSRLPTKLLVTTKNLG